MEAIVNNREDTFPWIRIVKNNLYTDFLKGIELENINIPYFPTEDIFLSDILSVFKNNRYNDDVSRAYKNGEKLGLEKITIDSECNNIINACEKNGVMFNICQLQRHIPYIGEFAGMLASELCCSVRIDAFCSSYDMSATPIHYDYDNAFIVQVVGSKNWRCYDNLSNTRLNFGGYQVNPEDIGDIHIEKMIQKGDGIFIPGGTLHQAFTTSHISVHLAIDLDPILLPDVASSWLNGRLRIGQKKEKSYSYYDNEKINEIVKKSQDIYNNASPIDLNNSLFNYRLWKHSDYVRHSWENIDLTDIRKFRFRAAFGAIFALDTSESKLNIIHSSWVPKASTSYGWSFQPANIDLPIELYKIVNLMLREKSFSVEELEDLIDIDSCVLLINMLGEVGILSIIN